MWQCSPADRDARRRSVRLSVTQGAGAAAGSPSWAAAAATRPTARAAPAAGSAGSACHPSPAGWAAVGSAGWRTPVRAARTSRPAA
eukprot:CAMPEP_0179969836 /NCGR_PEP_ID=MMETSP0983-20121128/34853_1 /TAXON_ID=483367 /ORGANISM="non described non described, Strain CCMP 2436" /LENGTH=85 /DNA_ID=CAMNT_0021884213 /DNA_START=20 /DNA_END=274 /DNA_ORIENTATION=+